MTTAAESLPQGPQPAAPQLPLKSRALRASTWMIVARPVGVAVQLVRSLILTRLLMPDAFGLMAIVAVVGQGLAMFSDIGLGGSVIQNPRGGEERFLQTIWTIQVGRGLVLWLLTCALAWPVAWFYDQPLLLWIMPIAGFGGFIGAFNTMGWTMADRKMTIGRNVLLVNAINIINLGVLVAAAWWLRSVWALVIGGLVSAILHVVLGHLFLPGIRHRLAWDRDAAREIIRFGKWIFLSTLLTYFAMQSDKLLLGKLVSMDTLGVYAIALTIASLPRSLVQQFAGGVLFPLLSEKFRTDPRRMHEKVTRVRGAVLRVGLLLTMGMAVVAPGFIHFYGSRYWEAGWMAQFLAVSVWMTMLNATTGYSLMSLGDSKSMALGNAANVAVTITAALVGYAWYGLAGFILGYAAGTAVGEIYQGMRIRRYGLGVLRQDLRFTLIGTAAMAVVIGLYVGIRSTGFDGGYWLESAVGLVVWAVVAGWFWPSLRRELPQRLARRLPFMGDRGLGKATPA